MDLIGKPTIHPVLFYSGKLAGYFTWATLILALSKAMPMAGKSLLPLIYVSFPVMAIAAALILFSLIHLGGATRLGLPKEDTVLKTAGVYKWSRNPMYLGFDLLTLASMMFTQLPSVIIAGVYSICIYHLIIRAEERFLEKRFGEDFRQYRRATRRYL